MTVTTNATAEVTPVRRLGPAAVALMKQFPPRRIPARWKTTEQPREVVMRRLLAPPFVLEPVHSQMRRKVALGKILQWLEQFPGQTWQDRWLISGADVAGNIGWRYLVREWLKSVGMAYSLEQTEFTALGNAILALISGDVIRPSLSWLLNPGTVQILTAEISRSRDPEGFAAIAEVCRTDPANAHTKYIALRRIATILAAKGGTVRDITVGDCVELVELLAAPRGGRRDTSAYFYQLLHAAGVFPDAAPSTVRIISSQAQGQLSVEQLIDRYKIECRPVRDLLVDYLRERQLAVDHTSLRALAFGLGKLFWKDLEDHHPGIDSLRLHPDVAAAWKQRVAMKKVRTKDADGDVIETETRRATGGLNYMTMVRAFYLDLAQWAIDDPSRWGIWAAPCPIREDELSRRKDAAQRKSRMDQRTRERLPVLPTLVRTVDNERRLTAERLDAARAAAPGEEFVVAGQRLRRSVTKNIPAKVWADDPQTGKRRDLTQEEHRAFWAWAIVEVLRHTGIRVEELSELSHHSLVQYRLPGSGELVPLLHIAPSKSDAERLLVIAPELADVLSAVICRIRDDNGAVPLVVSYDAHERVWNPPMPLLFQRHIGVENRPIPVATIRDLLNDGLAHTGLTDTTGNPLKFSPHDFRRFVPA
ncbi:site-specific integrase [Nocardia amamiensis]|uniref:Site-specific integrase n=1 Tax=Nocardia amamiensis TaxID=404578 RepID=A0ABS0D2V3_9NOCA|nr:site-specific integrase [Nocardia amamiensis]MBF6302981.1 site-specific integrase [Nocardia amamiensis]